MHKFTLTVLCVPHRQC
uniref:Uncharacterized protein n=1 Tax=Anguilla anguilla TaxID=7936 RepID=A0A0E9U5N5_ANGAN